MNAIDPHGLIKLPGAKSYFKKKLAERVLNNLRKRAVSDAWRMEKRLVEKTGRGTARWTKAQKEELLKTGKVKDYVGHHINNVKDYPDLAGNPNNIEFVKEGSEHLAKHGGNYQKSTSGPLLDRTAGGLLPAIVLQSGRTLYDFGGLLISAGLLGIEVIEWFDPISAFLNISAPKECY
jgi:hypothetical protein